MSKVSSRTVRLAATSVLTVLVVAILVTWADPATAQGFELSGRVTDLSAVPLAGSTVEVIDLGTESTVASTTTDANGDYALSVAGGTYDVRATPPDRRGD